MKLIKRVRSPRNSPLVRLQVTPTELANLLARSINLTGLVQRDISGTLLPMTRERKEGWWRRIACEIECAFNYGRQHENPAAGASDPGILVEATVSEATLTVAERIELGLLERSP